MLAAKFFDDHYLDNQHYAAVGGVPKGEMNVLELEFLFLLEFNLHVTRADYDMYRTALHAKFEVRVQGRHFLEDSYSEEPIANVQTRHHEQGAYHGHHIHQMHHPRNNNNVWKDVR